MRSGQHPYNNALFASQMAHLGEPAFRTWLTGLKTNLSVKPSGGDRTQVRRIYAGSCDVAIGNTYYMGKMQTNSVKPEQKDWARAVRIIFPDAQGRGTHINVSGMVMAKNAPNRDNALKLMEFLVSAEAQRLYAEVNFEYPVRAGVAPSALVAEWGTLKADPLPLETIAAYRKRVSEIVDEIGFNN
jgi:iron(III) transport system substrate-binding protein